ncbi:MAG: lipase secretion chaperone [Pseudoalteromonas prydzensis]|uniref:lipase secretion chaperone n=1 Tax=Pseudoalteromonas prydzensis TaxID=182141 RepID=UPI003F9631D1
MKWLFSLVLAIAVASSMLIYLSNPAQRVATPPPQVDTPVTIDNVFEHVILASQESAEFTALQAQQHCDKLAACRKNSELFNRYLSFKVALAELQQQLAHVPLSEQLAEMIAFQQRYFSEAEIALLFADDNQWQRYTIAKLAINADNSLTKELKQQLLANLDAEQPDEITQSLQATQQLQQLNNSYKDALQQQDYNQLAAEFGDAAATRLIALQQQRLQWQTLSGQLQQQIVQLKQHHDPQQAEQKIAQLLNQHFTENQKRRFLALFPQS